MSLHPALIFLLGLGVIIVGAELLLRGSSRIAAMLGVKPILIGMTVVAIGTSAPELAIGITSALDGKGALAVGNIAGTNIFNILVVLGLTAAIRPLPLRSQSIKVDVPVMAVSAVVLFLMAWDGVLSRVEGLILMGSAAIYFFALIRYSRKESAAMRAEFAEEYSPEALSIRGGLRSWLWNATLLVVGIAMTVIGADLLVDGAVALARIYHVSDAVIGLTIVAIGTSAPELVTTIVATIKDDRDVAVGNVIGSSITNILVILGLTCVAAPNGVDVSPDVLWIDMPLGAAVAAICYPVFRSDHAVSRGEGIAFLVAYTIYMGTLLVMRT